MNFGLIGAAGGFGSGLSDVGGEFIDRESEALRQQMIAKYRVGAANQIARGQTSRDAAERQRVQGIIGGAQDPVQSALNAGDPALAEQVRAARAPYHTPGASSKKTPQEMAIEALLNSDDPRERARGRQLAGVDPTPRGPSPGDIRVDPRTGERYTVDAEGNVVPVAPPEEMTRSSQREARQSYRTRPGGTAQPDKRSARH